MGNHNVEIINPQHEKTRHFEENKSLQECQKFMKEIGNPPKGWVYQIINTVKKDVSKPEFILVQGFTKDGVLVGQTRAGHRSNWGWYTVKMAKRDLRRQGATYFTRENIWETQEK